MSGLGWEVLGEQGGLRPFISGSYGFMIGMECIPRRNRNERIIMSSDGVPNRPHVFNNSSHVHLNVLSEKSGGHLRAELKSSLGFQCAFLNGTRRLHLHSSPILSTPPHPCHAALELLQQQPNRSIASGSPTTSSPKPSVASPECLVLVDDMGVTSQGHWKPANGSLREEWELRWQ